MKIGLFGGSFDPPHNAHVALARAARDGLKLDEVRWIPTGRAWQKTRAMTPAADREAMVRLAIDGEPGFVVDRTELERAGPSYMLDTVRALQAGTPDAEWFLMIGADQYAHFDSWHGWRELLARVRLAVAQRPGVALPANAEVQAHAPAPIALPLSDVASTDIRARAAAGLPLGELVPPQVARYIDRHALYRAATGS